MILLLSLLFIWLCLATFNHHTQLGAFSVEATLPLRGVLAFGIVLHHISLRITQQFPDMPVMDQFALWGAPIVAVFFFLSGYGLMKSLQVKGKSYLDGFLRKRLTKVALPFALCSLVFYLVNTELWGGQFSAFRSDWPFLPNAWFCVTIIVYYFAFYLIALAVRSKPKHLLVGMWLFSLCYIVCLKMTGFNNWWFQSVLSLNMGMTLVAMEGSMRRLLAKHCRPVTFVLFLLVSAICLFMEDIQGFPVKMMALSVVVGMLVYSLSCGYRLPTNKAVSFLGKYSYEIYLIHGSIIYVVFGIAYTYVPKWWVAMTLFTFLSTFALAWVLKKVVAYSSRRL